MSSSLLSLSGREGCLTEPKHVFIFIIIVWEGGVFN